MDYQRKQYRTSVWLWVALIVVDGIGYAAGGGILLVPLSLATLPFVLHFLVRVERLKWYWIPFWLLGASIPIVGFIAISPVIWYWAGRIAGVAESPPPVALTPEAARQKLADQMAEAVRAAEERGAAPKEGDR